MIASRFSVKVRGVTFHDAYPDNLHALRAAWGDEKPGEASLIREPDNEHDPNAIAVLAGGALVGHLPAGLAQRLAPELDAGARYTASATVLIDPDHPDRPGLLLECSRVVTEKPDGPHAPEEATAQ